MWKARKNEEEKCRFYFAKVYELKKGEAMKTKVTFEKLNCDFWDLSELKEPFENGELYHKASGQLYRIKNRSDLSLDAIVGSGVYKLVKKELTLRDEVRALDNDELRFKVFAGADEVFIKHQEQSDRRSVIVDFNTIHALSEILKRHGK